MSVPDYWRILHLYTSAGSNLTAPSGTLKCGWNETNRCGPLLTYVCGGGAGVGMIQQPLEKKEKEWCGHKDKARQAC